MRNAIDGVKGSGGLLAGSGQVIDEAGNKAARRSCPDRKIGRFRYYESKVMKWDDEIDQIKSEVF